VGKWHDHEVSTLRTIVEGAALMDSLDKIRLKGGPKVYKQGPRPTGRQRLEQRVIVLLLDAVRVSRKPTVSVTDASYAAELAHTLRRFVR
jgi:hypothetical protein